MNDNVRISFIEFIELLARDRIIQDDNLDSRAHTLHYYYVTQQKLGAHSTQYLST